MAEMWNGVADGWERNADFVDEHLAAATRVLLDAADVGEGDEVLELACGPGGVGIAAAGRVGPTGRVTLADVAEAMVAIAETRAARRGPVGTLVCDQGAIPAPDASYDAVLSRHGLMFADDPAAAVGEAVRVLRPEGRFAAMVWDRREANPWLGLILDAVGEQFGMTFPPPTVAGPFALGAPEELAAVLRRGRLQDVAVLTLDTPMPVTSLDAWWDRVPQLAGPLAIALAGMEPEVRDAIRDRALSAGAAVAHPAPDGLVFAGSVLIASGRAA
jgi:SAM-dependent methyltransferase